MAGRRKENNIRKFYEYDELNDTSTCILCKAKIKGNHATNLSKHVKTKHPNQFKEFEKENNLKRKKELDEEATSSKKQKGQVQTTLKKSMFRELIIKMDLKSLQDACVDLIMNGRTLNLMDDPAFHRIIDPILQGLNTDARINRENVRQLVLQKARKLQAKIAAELKGKLISIKLDACSKRDRSVLGLNAQYIDEIGKIVIRTLSVTDLTERHTGEYLNSVISKTLETYSIRILQVYCATTDNGANMVRTIKILEESINAETEIADEEDWDFNCITDDENEILNEDSHSFLSGQLRGFRCAAHTLQLTLHDVWKNEANYNEVIMKSRIVVKQLKKQNTIILLKVKQLNLAILDCPTRWFSTYLMVERLLTLKPFCQEYEATFPDLYLTETEWNSVKVIEETLKPLAVTTQALEAADITMSDLMASWTKCKILLRQKENDLAAALVKAMERREDVLFENEIFCASVFMDPRFKSLLNASQKTKAISHLLKTWRNMKAVEDDIAEGNEPEERQQPRQPDDPESCESFDDPFETYLCEHDAGSSSATKVSTDDTKEIEHILRTYGDMQRVKDRKAYPTAMDYWIQRKGESHAYWVLFKLATVALSAPSTQVSVERLFSSLAFIMSPLRSRLTPELLESILLVRSYRN